MERNFIWQQCHFGFGNSILVIPNLDKLEENNKGLKYEIMDSSLTEEYTVDYIPIWKDAIHGKTWDAIWSTECYLGIFALVKNGCWI